MPHWDWVLQSEIEAAPRAVLEYRHHAQDARRSRKAGPALWGDFTTIRVRHLRRLGIDLPEWLIAGTPCQAFSLAGLRKSMADARGNLTLEFVRLVHSLRRAGSLRGIVWENVPGVLSTADNAFGCFLGALVGADNPLPQPFGGSWPDAGMVAGAWARVAWRVLDAQHFGVPQQRKRVLVVADFGTGADPAAVLFEPNGVSRDAPSCGQGEKKDQSGSSVIVGTRSVVGTLNTANGKTRPGDTVQCLMAGHVIPSGIEANSDTARTLLANEGNSFNPKTDTLIGFSAKDYGADARENISPTLRAGGFVGSHQNGGVMPALANEKLGVRRFLPVECERLQGFPDGFTLVPYKGRMMSDGPRYKMCGNSKAVPCIRWVLERVEALAA